jgi:hypothetical protein
MRAFLLLMALLVAVPFSALAQDTFTLESVSHSGRFVTESKSLCLVSIPGTSAPLRLKMVQGLANPKLVSLESEQYDGYFLRHQNSCVKLHPYPESDGLFALDATFYLVKNADGTVSFRSYNYPEQYISVTASGKLYIATDPELPSRSFNFAQ